MNKILLALIICTFSITAFACPDHDGSKDKEKEEDKRFSAITKTI